MKEPTSSYEDYCRIWAEVYKKHARYANSSLHSCYVRRGILDALECSPVYPRPAKKITTDADEVGLYIVRALVAQGMTELKIEEYTAIMQGYVDDAEDHDIDIIDAIRLGLDNLCVDRRNTRYIRIKHQYNRLRYLWARYGGFDLVEAAVDKAPL